MRAVPASHQLYADAHERNGSSRLGNISSYFFSSMWKKKSDSPSFNSYGLGSRVSGGAVVVDKGDYFLTDAQRRQLRSSENSMKQRSTPASFVNGKDRSSSAVEPRRKRSTSEVVTSSTNLTNNSITKLMTSRSNVHPDSDKGALPANKGKASSQRDRIQESILRQQQIQQQQQQQAPTSARSSSSSSPSVSLSVVSKTSGKSIKQSKTVLVSAKSKQQSHESVSSTNQSSPASILAALNSIRSATAGGTAPVKGTTTAAGTPTITPISSDPSASEDDDNDDDDDEDLNNSTRNSSSLSKGGKQSGEKKDTMEPTDKGKSKGLCCDKCDGKHQTDDCPHYKKKRDNHPDAQRSKKHMGGLSTLPGATLRNARVVRQPGDGSCLFHSMSYGLTGSSNASKLRAEICAFIASNPSFKISDTPLKDWVKWDSGSSVSDYSRKMSRGSWGGGIEMACCSQIKGVNVHVYERHGTQFKRISAFDHPSHPESKPVVRVLYCGGVHYDALVA